MIIATFDYLSINKCDFLFPKVHNQVMSYAKIENSEGRMVQHFLCTMQIEGKRGGLPCLLAAATIQVGRTAAIWCYLKLLSPPKLSLCIYCHDKLFYRVWPS